MGVRRDGLMGPQAFTGPTLTPPGRICALDEGLAAITGTRQLPGNQEGDGVRSRGPTAPHPHRQPWPATHWAPGDTGPPWAEPLGTGGSWRAWALWGEGDTGGQCLPPRCPPAPPPWPAHAHLWLCGSPMGSGLFSFSMVWGGWGAPRAGTEVAGSLVALWGVGVRRSRPAVGPRPQPGVSREAAQTPGPLGRNPVVGDTGLPAPFPSWPLPPMGPPQSQRRAWAGGPGQQGPVLWAGSQPDSPGRSCQGPLEQLGGSDHPEGQAFFTSPRAPRNCSQQVTCPRGWGWSLSFGGWPGGP